MEAAAQERGGLPKRVNEEVRRYLSCGDVRRGFVHVQCEACQESTLVAFSCKTRGWCPSCGAKRAHQTAAHLGEILPRVPYRQWTLSLPRAFRWLVLKRPKLLRQVEKRLVRAVWRWQRQKARELGVEGELQGGAVSFVQLFGSSLQLTPHLHVLLPEGMWGDEAFVELPPPKDEEVEAVVHRLVRQLARAFEGEEADWPEDGLEALQQQGVQERLALPAFTQAKQRRVAVAEGFSLHADTAVHANDRQSLERLCRYGARGPVAESRLQRREDGRYEYQSKRGAVLVLSAEELVNRLVRLIPPTRMHLTSFWGVFAAHAKRRLQLVAPVAVAQGQAAALSKPPAFEASGLSAQRRPRLDWATLQHRTWGVDVWTCRCGGRRKVLSVVTSRRTAQEMLLNIGLLAPHSSAPNAQAPPQCQLALSV